MTHDASNHDHAPDEDSNSETAPTDFTPINAPSTQTVIDLDMIVERDAGSRKLDIEHVKHLRDTIAIVGLLQPVVLFNQTTLLAGRHRIHALRMLREESLDRFQELFPEGIPATVYELGVAPSEVDILRLEFTENSARRDYSAAELAHAVETLKGLGYTNKRGRRGKDDKPLTPALMSMFGVPRSSLYRALAAARGAEMVPDGTIPPKKDHGSKKAKPSTTVDGDPVPSDALELTLKLDPVQVACDAVERMTARELKRFNTWYLDHGDAVTVPVEDDDA